VTRFAPRGLRGPGPLSNAGMTLTELLLWMAFSSWAFVLMTAGIARLEEAVAIRSAVHETTVAFYRARSSAIARNRNVGLKFRKNGPRHEWTVYVDGNGNGVLSSEISSGVDPELGVYLPWSRNDVLPGIMNDIRVPDPSNPNRYLDRIDDPIRFNNSDICLLHENRQCLQRIHSTTKCVIRFVVLVRSVSRCCWRWSPVRSLGVRQAATTSACARWQPARVGRKKA
jgi:hypothetical protein